MVSISSSFIRPVDAAIYPRRRSVVTVGFLATGPVYAVVLAPALTGRCDRPKGEPAAGGAWRRCAHLTHVRCLPIPHRCRLERGIHERFIHERCMVEELPCSGGIAGELQCAGERPAPVTAHRGAPAGFPVVGGATVGPVDRRRVFGEVAAVSSAPPVPG
jgi:hypothetical protein